MSDAQRTGTVVLAIALLIAATCRSGPAQTREDLERRAARLITPPTAAAVDRGLAWLAKQQHDDGTFGTGNYRGNAGTVALGAIAFMTGGSQANHRGPYGPQVARSLDYILSIQQEGGYIVAREFRAGAMYGHGFATMFLAECYGASRRPELRERLAKAVKLILTAQNRTGGWRYEPQDTDADISVTVCEVMALRAARNAGIDVPKESLARAADYIRKCQRPDGGFMYRLSEPGPSAFPRSAAAVVGLYSAGLYRGPEIDAALKYLAQFKPKKSTPPERHYFFYGHYYAALAQWESPHEGWEAWYAAIRDDLLGRQRPDGSWDDAWQNPTISPELATAMACTILQIPYNYLPIFQR